MPPPHGARQGAALPGTRSACPRRPRPAPSARPRPLPPVPPPPPAAPAPTMAVATPHAPVARARPPPAHAQRRRGGAGQGGEGESTEATAPGDHRERGGRRGESPIPEVARGAARGALWEVAVGLPQKGARPRPGRQRVVRALPGKKSRMTPWVRTLYFIAWGMGGR